MTDFDDVGRPMMDIARGDVEASHRVRRNLELLQENARDPEFRRLIQEVLDGRRSLREAAGTPLFGSGMAPHLDAFAEKWDEATAEGQEVTSEESVAEFRRLQGRVQSVMAEIEDKVRELQRYQDDLEAGG
ncbi:hypothetical protein F8568_041035 [Actinomadura sp. LD22]|uniref:Uncharacterized protein n=1 Tax=Actinomadura physcomitrii TaxID=2650748 RepID=A0A6I4MS21_9ACTN|nr:hypothetical protein [Actinomadura physcomitrii]MWA06627.1 hypothetical protein [Actinomadura physcomitrii]